MGLDQYAYANEQKGSNEFGEHKFYWRKHSKLQKFIENELREGHSLESQAPENVEDLNCHGVELNITALCNLRELLLADILPESEGRFYFGHQWQDERAEAYYEQDMEFCSWAIDQIHKGHKVVYVADW